MKRPGVTILICCHNGAPRLPETIRHIAMQVVPDYIPWEFILIDNCCSDDSVLVARREWLQYQTSADFRIVHEPKLGLSNARARGFHEARYEYVIMCDDDNWLAPDYVNTVYQIMSLRPRVGALGGFGKLVFETPPPAYIELANIFAAGAQAPTSGKVKQNRIYGAGCVVRKSAYRKLHELGFKSLLSDRKGSELSSGGDYELCYALAILGYDIWYDERLRFSHFITRERLTWEYFMRYAKESALCFEVLACYKAIADDSAINKISLVHIARNSVHVLRRFMRVNFSRLLTSALTDEGRMLYFRHIVLWKKFTTYIVKFGQMMRIHDQILRFRYICEAAKAVEALAARKVVTPEFRVTSFSKPSKQLR